MPHDICNALCREMRKRDEHQRGMQGGSPAPAAATMRQPPGRGTTPPELADIPHAGPQAKQPLRRVVQPEIEH